MSLNLAQTALQIDQMAQQLRARQVDRDQRLQNAVDAANALDPPEYEAKREVSRTALNWRVPIVTEAIADGVSAPAVPDDFTVVGVDGSHIDVDRHLAARCFLINIGEVVLTYGSRPDANLSSHPELYADDEDLVIREEAAPYREQRVDGGLVGAKRTVEEIRALVDIIKSLPPDVPTLGLLDGSLLVFGLEGSHYQEFVRREIIADGFVAALEELRQLAADRPVSVASYISLPRGADAVNALRVQVCPFEVSDCERNCRNILPPQRPCELEVGGLVDRDVFAEMLSPGERTGVFVSASDLVDKFYQGHEVNFFYVHTGEEIGRVEVPVWIAEDEELLNMTHAIILDQCRRGPGYPVSIMEAHEQAVVSGSDRRYFVELVENALFDQRVSVYSSEKNLSKRAKWI